MPPSACIGCMLTVCKLWQCTQRAPRTKTRMMPRSAGASTAQTTDAADAMTPTPMSLKLGGLGRKLSRKTVMVNT